MSLADKPQIAVLTIQEAWRRLRRRLRNGPIHRLRFAGAAPDRLAVVPPTLFQGDSFVAEAIYGGRFLLAGRLVEVGRGSIFQVLPPSLEFAAELHGFSWLSHHAAAADALAAQNARALVSDWLRFSAHRLGGAAFEPEVAARRLISWLSHADLLLGSADYDFYRRFLKSLTIQTRYLRSIAQEAPVGMPRLTVRMALALVALCLPAPTNRIRVAAQQLADELDRQILPDGGHVSRNPAALATILGDLLPIRETLLGQGQPMPKGIYSAIDRMLPALRFFRHADGTLALFNGTGCSDMQLMAALMRDLEEGMPVKDLAATLPLSDAEIEDLLSMNQIPEGFADDLEKDAADKDKQAPEVVTIVLDRKQHAIWLQAVDSIEEEVAGARNPLARTLEILAARYLAQLPEA